MARQRRTVIDVKLKKGALSKFGYHVDDKVQTRHRALLRGARLEGYVPLIRRLGLQATFLKNNSPKKSKIFKQDQNWLSDHYDAWKVKNGGPETQMRPAPRLGNSRANVIGAGRKMTAMNDDQSTDADESDSPYGCLNDNDSSGSDSEAPMDDNEAFSGEEPSNDASSEDDASSSGDDNESSSGTDGGSSSGDDNEKTS